MLREETISELLDIYMFENDSFYFSLLTCAVIHRGKMEGSVDKYSLNFTALKKVNI